MAISGSTVRAFRVEMKDGKPNAVGATLNVHASAAYSDALPGAKGSLDEAIGLLRAGQSVTVDAGNMQFVELCRRMGSDFAAVRQECHQ